ncbi:hypothetical protein A2818_01225 [Candidatus Nomurabacteria bacterium RIFCSPHIGHO2_01_FULL_40_12]|uniref:Type IV pilus modification protein PilV n=1 Tax=Candidatus Nomurabacteria bacterium RIFCSPHIGHO2_01_FULL_40_12 TaxID=1801737 RepID=A0A1F6V130_9BACT|nr:MAG: hypothetical protein A2818_01225 [Candidatus Nomurabacteria bacterium RIFCSPHIGHO2_01_FULL_40_12]
MMQLFKFTLPWRGKQNKKNGFTLVETLVAISIFTVSLIGLMSVLASGIAATNYAKQKMVASYLAQEGIEYARNIRDTFVLYDVSGSQSGWNRFRDDSVAGITPTPPADANFSRTIQKVVLNPDEVKISSTVSWVQGSGSYNIVFSESLFNWIE